MAKRNGSTATDVAGKPKAEAREALAMWGLALRYATAAVKPAAKGATQGVKERLASATSSETSLKDRLNPSKTEKGGKVGDAADALLEKMGTPGKLAAKASVGSRVVERLTPGTSTDAPDAEQAAEPDEPAEEPEAEVESEEPVEEPQADEAEEDGPQAADESEPSDSDADGEDQDDDEADEDEPAEASAEDDEDDEDEPAEADAEDDEPSGRGNGVKPHSKPIEPHPGAQPLHTDFDHAYADEVENYEHQDAYATTR
jgi:hypothetical protein